MRIIFHPRKFSQKRANRFQSCKPASEWVLEPQSRPLVFVPCFWCRALRIHRYLLGPEDGGLCRLASWPFNWFSSCLAVGRWGSRWVWPLSSTLMLCTNIWVYVCTRTHRGPKNTSSKNDFTNNNDFILAFCILCILCIEYVTCPFNATSWSFL